MTHITTEVDEAPVIRTAFNSGVEDIRILSGRPINNPKVFMVFINGNILGVTYGYQRLIKVRKTIFLTKASSVTTSQPNLHTEFPTNAP